MYTEENMNEIKIGPKLTFDRQILLNNTWRFINCTQRAYVDFFSSLFLFEK